MAHLAPVPAYAGRHRRITPPRPVVGRHRRSRRPLSERLGAVLVPLGAALVVAFATALPSGRDV